MSSTPPRIKNSLGMNSPTCSSNDDFTDTMMKSESEHDDVVGDIEPVQIKLTDCGDSNSNKSKQSRSPSISASRKSKTFKRRKFKGSKKGKKSKNDPFHDLVYVIPGLTRNQRFKKFESQID